MKKILFIAVLFFNLVPVLKKGKICFELTQIYGQTIPGGAMPGGVYNPTGNGGYAYAGQVVGSSYSGAGQSVYYFNGASGLYGVYSCNTGERLGDATIQGVQHIHSNGNSGGGGESMGDEDGGDDGSDWPDYDPGDWGGGSGGGPMQLQFDCYGEINGSAYINLCGKCVGGRTGILDSCTPNSRARYYLMINGYNTKYYNGDTIYVPKGSFIDLKIDNQNGVYQPMGTEWKRNDTSKCPGLSDCFFNVSARNITSIKVDSIAGTPKNLINCPLVVYDPPNVYFKVGSDYQSEYGFDDSAYKYLKDSARYQAGYKIITIHKDTSYVVPWMSLLDGQAAAIRIIAKGGDSLWTTKDVNSEANFITNNPNIKINNGFAFTTKYKQLYTLAVIQIQAQEWNIKADSLKSIGEIAVAGIDNDYLGKLAISCAKPINKRLVIVYVNTGNGYSINPVHSKQAILDQLNNHSHNQIMRQWILDTANSINGMDTINLTNEYLNNPSKFLNADTICNTTYINKYYYLHKGIGLASINAGIPSTSTDPDKVHFMFVFTYTALNLISGMTQRPGYLTCIFDPADAVAISHEMGHILNMDHTFSEIVYGNLEPRYNIPKYMSGNFMDYRHYTSDPQKIMFYYSQWITTW
jgi:hypothetical protein